MRLIQFATQNDEYFLEQGILPQTLHEIFLGPRTSPDAIKVAIDTPTHVRDWIAREHGAASFAFRSLRDGNIQVPGLWSGKPITCAIGYSCPNQGQLPYEIPPLFYRLVDYCEREFWLISYSVYGRITHIYIPTDDVMIYDFDPQSSTGLSEIIHNHLLTLPFSPFRAGAFPNTVAILNMVNNYGHQMINQLGGLARLLEESNPGYFGEIWISGNDFFSSVEKLFPEYSGRIRRFQSPWDIDLELRSGVYLPIRIGANIFYNSVRTRILKSNKQWFALNQYRRWGRWPLVAVTVRTTGQRVCNNLPQAIGEIINKVCTKYPKLGLIIDGFVLPDSIGRSTTNTFLIDCVNRDIDMSRRIEQYVPKNMVVCNTIGRTMSESLRMLSKIDAYISHVGTLQHKLGFFTGTRGIVHGPKDQLMNIDAGHFSTEYGFGPLFLSPGSVRDISINTNSNPMLNDYEIIDTTDLVEKLDYILDLRT